MTTISITVPDLEINRPSIRSDGIWPFYYRVRDNVYTAQEVMPNNNTDNLNVNLHVNNTIITRFKSFGFTVNNNRRTEESLRIASRTQFDNVRNMTDIQRKLWYLRNYRRHG